VAIEAFAPFRLRPGDALPEAEVYAAETGGAPLVVDTAERRADGISGRTWARIAAGRAMVQEEACRDAEGRVSGVSGAERACLHSAAHRRRVADLALQALDSGHPGLLLDRPDADLALGLFGAGFSDGCQEAFLGELGREYGPQLEPIDYRRLAREALAAASGAVSFEQLHFGRDFWRFRNESLPQALQAYLRPVRDRARETRREFFLGARFDGLGPAQVKASRFLDAVVFPLRVAPHQTGVGTSRLWRAVMGERFAAAEIPGEPDAAELTRLAGALACSGVDVAFEEGERARTIAPVRRLARDHGARRGGTAFGDPVVECLVFYSAEADLWTRGLHRMAVEEAGETLSRLHVQWMAATGIPPVRPGTVLVLAQASALAASEAAAVKRFLELGGLVLAFGDPGLVDEGGQALPSFLPEGKASGSKVGEGTLAVLPPLLPNPAAGLPIGPAPVEPVARVLDALRGRWKHAAEVHARTPVLASLWRTPKRLDIHLVSLSPEPLRGATLVLGDGVAGSARRGRLRTTGGEDHKFVLNPSGWSVSTVLPAFQGYAILSLVP